MAVDKKQEDQPKTNDQAIQGRDERNISDSVLKKIKQLESNGALKLSPDYSAENALKSAYLNLLEVVDKDKKPALTVCTKESIANALLDMVVQGLNPVKKQCFFIVRGTKLCMDRSYPGTIMVAKRVGGLKRIKPVVIYNDDIFKYEIVPETGRIKVISHEQKLDNIDIAKIKGAYAIYELEDGSTDVELMTMPQIRKAWEQGSMNGKSGAHLNFTDQMCGKTVIGRACKLLINASDDATLFESESDPTKMDKIPGDANTIETSFEDVTNDQIAAATPIEIKPETNGTSKETIQVEANQQNPELKF